MSLGLHLAVLEQAHSDMPSITRPNRRINQLDGHVGLSKETHAGISHCNGLIDMKEYSLISHIESLKAVANGNAPFCNTVSGFDDEKTNAATIIATRSNPKSISPPSCQNEFPQIVSLSHIADHLESAHIKPKPPTTSKWVMDPDSVPGNLRKDAEGKHLSLTLEEILSRASSSVTKKYEIEDDNNGDDDNEVATKIVLKHRKKSAKSLKRKHLKSKDSIKSTSLGGIEGKGAVSSTLQAKKEVEGKFITTPSPFGDIASLTALCKGMKIQEKQLHHSISVKNAPYSRKTCVSNSQHLMNASPFRKSLENAVAEYTKKSQPSVSHADHHKKVSEDNAKMTKVYLSEKQSGVISDCGVSVPCAPPATPTPDQLKRFEYIPSLQDIRSQRSFRQRLQMMEMRAMKKEKKKQADHMKFEKMSLRERRIELKKKQRQEIYALNKLMTDLENERFRQFMLVAGPNI